jgi:hypothetical protein
MVTASTASQLWPLTTMSSINTMSRLNEQSHQFGSGFGLF